MLLGVGLTFLAQVYPWGGGRRGLLQPRLSWEPQCKPEASPQFPLAEESPCLQWCPRGQGHCEPFWAPPQPKHTPSHG